MTPSPSRGPVRVSACSDNSTAQRDARSRPLAAATSHYTIPQGGISKSRVAAPCPACHVLPASLLGPGHVGGGLAQLVAGGLDTAPSGGHMELRLLVDALLDEAQRLLHIVGECPESQVVGRDGLICG